MLNAFPLRCLLGHYGFLLFLWRQQGFLHDVVFLLDMKLPFIFLLLSWAYIHIFGSKRKPFTSNIVIMNVSDTMLVQNIFNSSLNTTAKRKKVPRDNHQRLCCFKHVVLKRMEVSILLMNLKVQCVGFKGLFAQKCIYNILIYKFKFFIDDWFAAFLCLTWQ